MLDDFLFKRYQPGSERRDAVREYVAGICKRFIEAGLADDQFLERLCFGDEASFWQRYTEARLACELMDAGYEPSSAKIGPDLVINHNGKRIWIEIVTPTPVGIPEDWLRHESNTVVDFPQEAITLRWTTAIKEKIEKLLGNEEKLGYVRQGVVGPEDAYIIAVNGRMLRDWSPQLNGISQIPFAAEIAFAVGAFKIDIDRKTLKAVGSGHRHRPFVIKPNNAAVPTYTFMDPACAPISAIWAVDLDDTTPIGNRQPMSVIHNPYAVQSVPLKFLPAHEEWTAEFQNENGTLQRQAGALIK